MKAVHFGAGNIGRGFIGEVYHDNHMEIIYVDVNERVIDALNKEHQIKVIFASDTLQDKILDGVTGINSIKNPEKVDAAFLNAKIISASVGANNLKFIAQDIARGLNRRMNESIETTIDVVACENMIEGSAHLKALVLELADENLQAYIEKYVGFPNAAIDRIVPEFKGDNPLDVRVEPFREWIIETKDLKSDLKLDTVLYVDDLIPYIERKLFSVNTGHASLAYTGIYYGYDNTIAATQDKKVMDKVKHVLENTSEYLIKTYDFDEEKHQEYVETLIKRFSNPLIKDDLYRIARNPISKLHKDERLIKPLRKLYEKSWTYDGLLNVLKYVFHYRHQDDAESVRLNKLLEEKEFDDVIKEVTGLKGELVNVIVDVVKNQ